MFLEYRWDIVPSLQINDEGVEKVGLSGVLNQKLVLETVPPIIQNKEPPNTPCLLYTSDAADE